MEGRASQRGNLVKTAMSLRRRSILICDGNPDTVSILRYVLEVRRGDVITEATCAYDALEAMKYITVHVLLANCFLYGLGRDELIRLVKAIYPETKILVYSDDGRLWRQRQESIADGYVIGPLTHLGPLLEQVRILAKRKRGPKKYHAPYVAKRRQVA